MLRCLLQPMPDCVLEELVPDHWSRPDRVDSPAGGAEVLVLLHQVHQQAHGRGLKGVFQFEFIFAQLL